jgi:hypothetical protein
MTVQTVDCTSGFSGYRTDYNEALRKQFPNHGGTHFTDDHGILYAHHLRIYVCPECTKAYYKWLAENPGK